MQTPMGQLFDHGCDVLCCFSHHSMAMVNLAMGPGLGGLCGQTALCSGIWMAQWQECYTGELKTCMGAWGVTELQYTLMAFSIAVGIAGPEATAATMHSSVSLPWVGQLRVDDIIVVGWALNCWTLVAISFTQTMQFIQKGPVEGRRKIMFMAIRDLTPMVAMTLMSLLWSRDMQWESCRLVSQLTGLIYALSSWQVVIFSMAKMPNDNCHPALVAYGVLVALSNIPGISMSTLQLVTTAVTFGILGYMVVWIYCTTCQLSEKLNIKVFTVDRALWDKKD